MDWLELLLGARVIHVERKMTWDGRHVESMIIKVLRNMQVWDITVNASTFKGCRECDEDGSAITYLDMSTKEAKGPWNNKP